MNPTALKERLKVVAKERGITFNEAWKHLLLERFLARLSHSDQQEKFIFKGGLLLAQYLVIGRETSDADFLMTKLKSEAPAIEAALRDVIANDLADGFAFSWSGLGHQCDIRRSRRERAPSVKSKRLNGMFIFRRHIELASGPQKMRCKSQV